MAKKVKLMGGTIWYQNEQCRCIVLATSQKQAAEITGESLARIRTYCETQNQVELEAAKGFASGMWIAPLNNRNNKEDYIKIK